MDTRINPVRYPTLFRYLANLPQGIQSYPHCKTRTNLPRMQLDRFPQIAQIADLPEEIKKAVVGPWPADAWTPEVHLMSQSALVRDVVCRSDEVYLKTRFDIARESFQAPMVRTLMSLVSPNLMALASAHRWSHFKQGTQMKTLESDSVSLKVSLKHEPNLYLKCMLDGIAKVFEAALSCSRAHEVRSTNETVSPSETIFTFYWVSKTKAP